MCLAIICFTALKLSQKHGDFMDKQELIKRLYALEYLNDPFEAHLQADEALTEFINDPEIKEAFDRLDKWYN